MFIKLLLAIVELRKLRSNFLPLLLYLALFLFDKFGLSTFKTEDSFNALSEYDTREENICTSHGKAQNSFTTTDSPKHVELCNIWPLFFFFFFFCSETLFQNDAEKSFHAQLNRKEVHRIKDTSHSVWKSLKKSHLTTYCIDCLVLRKFKWDIFGHFSNTVHSLWKLNLWFFYTIPD